MCPPTGDRRLSELERYLEAPTPSVGVLEFWSEHEASFPRLSKLARVCLGVPASSGAVERLFSTAGSLQRARRSSLLPRTVEHLILVAETIRNREGLSQ